MNKLFKDKTQEYISFLKKFINDIYSGKIELDKDECQELDEYLRGLSDTEHILDRITATSCLDSFNGDYDMSIKNSEYYMNSLCEKHGLKCIKDKKLARWTIIKNNKKFIFTCHYSGPKDINNVFNNYISFDYTYPYGRYCHEEYQSFSDLDWQLYCISTGMC